VSTFVREDKAWALQQPAAAHTVTSVRRDTCQELVAGVQLMKHSRNFATYLPSTLACWLTPYSFSKCIHLLNWFSYQHHVCLVFKLLGISLHDFLVKNKLEPYPRDHVQSFVKQLLDSVACTYSPPLISKASH